MNIKELMQAGVNVSITVTPTDLKEFALTIIEEAKDMAKAENKPEEYLTPQDVAKICGVTGNTLWRWNRDGYLHTVKLGRKNFYRKSDIEKLREGR